MDKESPHNGMTTEMCIAYKNVFKVMGRLDNVEQVALLEIAKTDIILNRPLVVIDGKYGGVIKYGERN